MENGVMCPKCQGTGEEDCQECGGDGCCPHCSSDGSCVDCAGGGKTDCSKCDGAKIVPASWV